MNVTEWVNEDKKNKYNAIKHLYKRYASCCIELGGSLEAVDDFLVRFGFQTIVKLVSEDVKEGGTHKIERNENTPQFITIDNFTFIDCKLLSQSEYFLESLKCESMLPLKNHYGIGEEGERLLVILADIIMPSAFGKQEPLPLPIVDMQEFFKTLLDKHTYSKSFNYDETTADVSIEFREDATNLLCEFIAEHFDEITDETLRKVKIENDEFFDTRVVECDDGKIMTINNGSPIDRIGVDFECVRESEDICFRLTSAVIYVYSDDYRRAISEKMHFDSDTAGIGKVFDLAIKDMEEEIAMMKKMGFYNDDDDEDYEDYDDED